MKKTYTCIIVDDEEIDRLTIAHFVKQYPFLKILGSFSSSTQALNFAKTNLIDILFLDVDMPGINGLDLRKELSNTPVCIFISSYPDYAADSFETAVLDFIVKPVKAERFDRAINRLQNYMEIYQKSQLLDHTLGGDALFIKDGYTQIKIQLHDVIYLEALKDYTSVVTSDRKYCVHSILGNLLTEKSFQSFVRIHRSYAVQKHFVQKITAKEVFVKDTILPVGRTYKEVVEGLIN
jgi:two-component system LytT family response regulator